MLLGATTKRLRLVRSRHVEFQLNPLEPNHHLCGRVPRDRAPSAGQNRQDELICPQPSRRAASRVEAVRRSRPRWSSELGGGEGEVLNWMASERASGLASFCGIFWDERQVLCTMVAELLQGGVRREHETPTWTPTPTTRASFSRRWHALHAQPRSCLPYPSLGNGHHVATTWQDSQPHGGPIHGGPLHDWGGGTPAWPGDGASVPRAAQSEGDSGAKIPGKNSEPLGPTPAS